MHNFLTFTERLLLPKNAILLVILAVFLAHGSSLGGGFVWDDTYTVANNKEIRSLTNIPDFFKQSWGAGAEEGSRAREKNRGLYRPLTLVTYTTDYALYGLSPTGFQLSNILIHLLGAIILLLAAYRLCGARAGLFIALIWAIHPVHTEAISVLSYRTTLLAGFLGFSSLYIQLKEERRGRRVFFRTLLVALACFAKEDGIVFAAVLPLHDLLIRRISFKNAVLNAIPLLLFAILFFTIRAQILEGAPYSFYAGTSATNQIAGVMQANWLYARLLALPFPLTPFYDWSIFPIPEGWLQYEVIAGFLLTSTLVWLSLRFKHNPMRAFLAMSVLLTTLPYSHVLPFTVGAAERFFYVPSFFALCLVVHCIRALDIPVLKQKNTLKRIQIATLFWLIPMMAWSSLRHQDWQSQHHITKATTEYFPKSFNAWVAYGDELHKLGKKEDAAMAYGNASKASPLPIATLRQVEILLELGEKEQALQTIRRYVETYGLELEQRASGATSNPLVRDLGRLKELKKELTEP